MEHTPPCCTLSWTQVTICSFKSKTEAWVPQYKLPLEREACSLLAAVAWHARNCAGSHLRRQCSSAVSVSKQLLLPCFLCWLSSACRQWYGTPELAQVALYTQITACSVYSQECLTLTSCLLSRTESCRSSLRHTVPYLQIKVKVILRPTVSRPVLHQS
jgi:hypothetical protein